MPISDSDIKLLWGRAAGICSNPSCKADLTIMITSKEGFNIGEMAHVIAERERGPRGIRGGGSNAYGNLILLCPTCHSEIDKAPEGLYTANVLLSWKLEHEAAVRQSSQVVVYTSFEHLRTLVSQKLVENFCIWSSLGPKSAAAYQDPSSNIVGLWSLLKLSTIIPNNHKIIHMIESNQSLLSSNALRRFYSFKIHAAAFEKHQYERLDHYPVFPTEFAAEFSL